VQWSYTCGRSVESLSGLTTPAAFPAFTLTFRVRPTFLYFGIEKSLCLLEQKHRFCARGAFLASYKASDMRHVVSSGSEYGDSVSRFSFKLTDFHVAGSGESSWSVYQWNGNCKVNARAGMTNPASLYAGLLLHCVDETHMKTLCASLFDMHCSLWKSFPLCWWPERELTMNCTVRARKVTRLLGPYSEGPNVEETGCNLGAR
jgi:hypothetical protein